MQFYVMTRPHVRQFKLVHVAKCHSTIWWIMSSYFPMTGFKATVCASTGDNRHNCALPDGENESNRWDECNHLLLGDVVKYLIGLMAAYCVVEMVYIWMYTAYFVNGSSPYNISSMSRRESVDGLISIIVQLTSLFKTEAVTNYCIVQVNTRKDEYKNCKAE